MELAPFSIRVLLVAPGSFRTEGIFGQAFNTRTPIPAYDTLRATSKARNEAIAGTERGDPDKATEAVIDVVRGEGAARGRAWPGCLVLGEDAERDLRERCERTLRELDEWTDVSRSVAFDS